MTILRGVTEPRAIVRGAIVRGGGAAPPAPTYATWNPADNGGQILSNGDLRVTGSGWLTTRITIPKGVDEWCCEHSVYNSSGNMIVGICTADATLGSFVGSDAYGFGYYSANGNIMNGGGGTAGRATWNTNTDVIGLKYNATARTATWYKNGTQQGAPVDISSLVGDLYVGCSNNSGGDITDTNFGATPMTYDYTSANVGVFTS